MVPRRCLCWLTTLAAVAAADDHVRKAARPSERDFSDSLRMDSGCDGCFPGHYEDCADGQWSRCCAQEIACHDSHCRGNVVGDLQPNTKVRVRTSFLSDDEQPVELSKGMSGRVLRVDGEGDALIRFSRDEYDDEVERHWVFKRTAWKHIDFPERSVRMRASRVASCMDNCTIAMDCRMQQLAATKKGQKTIQACLKECKFDDCQSNDECRKHMDAYNECKSKTAMSEDCAPQKSHSSAKVGEL